LIPTGTIRFILISATAILPIHLAWAMAIRISAQATGGDGRHIIHTIRIITVRGMTMVTGDIRLTTIILHITTGGITTVT
jgi:hypothetical protein